MILIIGGESAGKRSFARSLGFTDEQMTDSPDSALPVVYHAELLVKTQQDVPSVLEKLQNKQVVIANEVGSGVIPAVHALTAAREAGGRLTILLAKRACCVVRLVCGIPQILKGSLPEEFSNDPV